MKFIPTAALTLLLAATTAWSSADARSARAKLNTADGQSAGKVELTETPHGVLLSIDLKNIPPDGHGFHIHSVGACEPDFKAAKGHSNPTKSKHGINNPEGMHAGDMPNVFAHADGTVQAEILNANISLKKNAPNSLFDEDRSAIIVHAKPDTHGEKPGAGKRVACGVIRRVKE